ncbi:MAG TPA: porin family protein [Anseongella sp.]|nr:porin family protein [Anseongella sp.]
MKKQLLLLGFACLAFGLSNSFAQTTFGVKAGANIADVNFDTGSSITLNPDVLVGFYAGGFARLGVSSKFSVQPELLLSLQGFKFNLGELSEEGGDFEVSSKNLYLNLPVMARFAATEALHLEAGPQVGLLLNSKGEIEGISAEDEDSYKDIDFGVNVGAGYTLPMGLSIEARYNFGLANIVEGLEDTDASVTNRVLSFGLGYTF